jgi:glutamate formiminotransferase/formiminotetrahydrofolate cyclodeaminase
MSQPVVECVPNFSEGRDPARIRAITDAIAAVPGIRVLDVDSGADTHRTVVTFAGPPEPVLEAAFQAVRKASQVLDMRTHRGAHPRMGATDVCPFVPVTDISLDACAELSRRLGERVGRELEIPVYLYEHAASRPERHNLAQVRKGEYEGLAARLQDPQWAPDYGPARVHPTAGALITGARAFLIAYNINLNSRDKAHATDIAFELREKGRVARRGQTSAFYSSGRELRYAEGCYPCGNCGFDAATLPELEAHCRGAHGYDLARLLRLNDLDPDQDLVGQKAYRAGRFSHCKAIGWYVDAYKRAQLSINLTDYQITGPEAVLEAARSLAADRGLVVTGSEIVGLVPCQALVGAGRHYLKQQGKSPFVPVPDLLATAVASMGLADVAPFELDQKVLGLPGGTGAGLVDLSCAALVDEVSRDTPAPGGGSIAALAGALGAGLASMVANLAQGRTRSAQDEGAGLAVAGQGQRREDDLLAAAEQGQRLKDQLLLGVDADTQAFNGYLEARRLPQRTPAERSERAARMQEGLRSAVAVPLATAEASLEVLKAAERALAAGNPASITDAMVGLQLAFAGVRGGLWNVLINLKDITDPAFTEARRQDCARLLAEARELLDRALARGDAALEGMLATGTAQGKEQA